ncbi:DivIVA domain [Ruminiclostridium papyrosolvens DSM 2782]|uniref:DivIVA domain n=1 Tax=Ruminiclostridium papyrosolvens DSM 2782 TaxID=588581 RepID=F1TEM0_9FIRM|nr:DivIVA domain-containing protein [Ruminiclostridium papyrosolvens]EGD47186.1 DivIVA domain [Ruminiclostridium papyrosolvens DSM 2782]WES36226.1 DivIVA domain-containing protein [Ruminiclostridium papyrosolvens DSM 2782]
MNYTPNDLDNIKFKKNFMGYNEDQVNEVLDSVIQDYELYIKENIELKDRISVLNEGIQHYKNIEESLQNTLIVAQQTGEEIKKNSYEKAENITKEAELKAQRIINDANQEVIKIRFEYEEMKKRLHLFKTKSETLLLSQLELLKQLFNTDNDIE